MPDFRNRFLVSAGSSYSVGNTGGANSVALSVGQMPIHSHGTSFITATPVVVNEDSVHDNENSMGVTLFGCVAKDWFYLHTGRKDPDEPNDFAYSFGGGGAKSDLTIIYWETDSNNTGGGQSHENRPPYIAVKWMIKAK